MLRNPAAGGSYATRTENALLRVTAISEITTYQRINRLHRWCSCATIKSCACSPSAFDQMCITWDFPNSASRWKEKDESTWWGESVASKQAAYMAILVFTHRDGWVVYSNLSIVSTTANWGLLLMVCRCQTVGDAECEISYWTCSW